MTTPVATPVATPAPTPSSRQLSVPLKSFPGGPNLDDLASKTQVSVYKQTTNTPIYGTPIAGKPDRFTLTATSYTANSHVNYSPIIQPGKTLRESSTGFQGSYEDAVESARTLNRRDRQAIGVLNAAEGKFFLVPLKGDGPRGNGHPRNSRQGAPLEAKQVVSTRDQIEQFVRRFPSDEPWIDNALKNLPKNGATTYQQLITKVEPHNKHVVGLVLSDGYYDLRHGTLHS
jgi:hypothetical protein